MSGLFIKYMFEINLYYNLYLSVCYQLAMADLRLPSALADGNVIVFFMALAKLLLLG